MFPSTVLLDNFNFADGPLSANWTIPVYETGQSSLVVSSNQLTSDVLGASTRAHAYWSGQAFGPDSEAYVEIVNAGGQVVSLFVRLKEEGGATADGYAWRRDVVAGTDEINRIDNGVFTLVGVTVAGSYATGDTFGLEAIGSNFTVYRKPSGGSWGSLFVRTDTTYTGAGHIGVECWGTTVLDNFGGGTVGTAPDTIPTGIPSTFGTF